MRLADGGLRGQRGISQPVMAGHSFLIRIGNGAALEGVHGGEGLLHTRLHRVEIMIREIHPAQVQGQAERGITGEILLVSFPERFRCRCHSAGQDRCEREESRMVADLGGRSRVPACQW